MKSLKLIYQRLQVINKLVKRIQTSALTGNTFQTNFTKLKTISYKQKQAAHIAFDED